MAMSDIEEYLETLSNTILKIDTDQTVVLLKPNLEDVNQALPLYFELGQQYDRNLKITKLNDADTPKPSDIYFFQEKPIRYSYEEIQVYLADSPGYLSCVLTHYYMPNSQILTRNNTGDTREFIMLRHPEVSKKQTFINDYKFCLDLPYEYTMSYREDIKPLELYLGYRRNLKTRKWEVLSPDQLTLMRELYKTDDLIIELIPKTWNAREIIENRSQLFPKPDLLFVWSSAKPIL